MKMNKFKKKVVARWKSQGTERKIIVVLKGATLTDCTLNIILENEMVHVQSNEKQRRETGQDAIKLLLQKLFEATIEMDGKTVPLMVHQEQWYAVYRVLNEKCNYPKKMTDFYQTMTKKGMTNGRVPCVYSSLKSASGKLPKLACSVTLWEQYKELSDVYREQCAVAVFLLKELGMSN